MKTATLLLRSRVFPTRYDLHVSMHAFACEYAPASNEAVFVLIKREGCINTVGNGNI